MGPYFSVTSSNRATYEYGILLIVAKVFDDFARFNGHVTIT